MVGAEPLRGVGTAAVTTVAAIDCGTNAIRLLVAATVLATLALGGAGRVDAWTDQMARLDAGAAVQVPFDGGALEALQLTRSLDPQGRWLMAAAFVPGPSGGSSRRVFVDSERYDRVVGDLLDDAAGTSLGAALAAVRRAAPAPPVILGDTWRVGAVVAREACIPAGLRGRHRASRPRRRCPNGTIRRCRTRARRASGRRRGRSGPSP